MALRADGSIVSWGADNYDQISGTPTGSGFTAIATGGDHGLALRADGSVLSWGFQPMSSATLRRGTLDNCPLDFNPGQEDTDSNGTGDACNEDEDADGDEWADDLDNCVFSVDQTDTDSNGTGDACNEDEDADGDEWADDLDSCPDISNGDQLDTDADGYGQACDNCPSDANVDQLNADGDAAGDLCDAFPTDAAEVSDSDLDGWGDNSDNCPLAANPSQADGDSDGVGDLCDNCPSDPNADQIDTSNNGAGDVCSMTPVRILHRKFFSWAGMTKGFLTPLEKRRSVCTSSVQTAAIWPGFMMMFPPMGLRYGARTALGLRSRMGA